MAVVDWYIAEASRGPWTSQKADKLWGFYRSVPKEERDRIDKELGIGKYAEPEVGEGFVIVSGGEPRSGHATDEPGHTWNFHWAGVVMKSLDRADTITLENDASTKAKGVENTEWRFQMYGREDQSFHAESVESEEFGEWPTTVRVRKPLRSPS
jgi:hypothetical protein